ncbi:ABC transporter permease [Kaistia sp. K-TC2]|uniref:ABC transporter permease n=2 Tax=Kaistiaceae TaxID=2831111 RepID=A0A9X3E534_9HYPH|nr:ABC transporter permease [Kaistia nematophila]MCX5571709.1 ABC transporter permease [Kaistia nematophila]
MKKFFRWCSGLFQLFIKELRSIKADPIMLVLVLYTFTLAVYSVSSSASTELKNLAVAVVDEDDSQLSRRILGALQPPIFQEAVKISPRDVDTALNEGRFVFVLDIPPNFERDVRSNRAAELQVEIDATAMAFAGNGVVALQNVIANEISEFRYGGGIEATAPVRLVMRNAFNPNLNSVWFGALMQVMNNVTMLTLILSGAALIRERERGTVEHLLVMPVGAGQIVLAKILANGLIIVAAATLSLIFVVQMLLGVPIQGSIGLFLLGTTIYTLSIASMGILVATFSTSMAQFGLLAIPVLIVLNLLSGSATPLESMPVWLRYTMQALTTTPHFVSFTQAVLFRGGGFPLVWQYLLIFLAFGGAYFFVSLARFRSAVLKG